MTRPWSSSMACSPEVQGEAAVAVLFLRGTLAAGEDDVTPIHPDAGNPLALHACHRQHAIVGAHVVDPGRQRGHVPQVWFVPVRQARHELAGHHPMLSANALAHELMVSALNCTAAPMTLRNEWACQEVVRCTFDFETI